ncbi:MAG: hypothetical protein OEZ06_29680 [Myxococcales bacterium]|nr:hypothetical protein [Myxococcales bacterium]
MSFSRQLEPLAVLEGAALDGAMAGIGMAFAVKPELTLAIEDVLFFASRLGVEQGDYRVLSVLCKWIDVHGRLINADRLTRLVQACADDERTLAFWAAAGQWKSKDRRFSRLAKLRPREQRLDLFGAGTDFQVRRRGEHPWFEGTCLRVPADTLRDREGDVLTPEALARLNPIYRERLVQGPSYRADMWAALQLDPSTTASELARKTYGSFATAWEVKRDFDVVRAAA